MGSKFKYKLRDKVKDNITGVKYVVIGVAEYVSYVRYNVQQPALDEKGKPHESDWLDEDRLDLDE